MTPSTNTARQIARKDSGADPAFVNHASEGCHGPTGFDRGEECIVCRGPKWVECSHTLADYLEDNDRYTAGYNAGLAHAAKAFAVVMADALKTGGRA